jgi:tight adherence protein C
MYLFNYLRTELTNLLSMRLFLVCVIGIAAFLFLRGLFATVTWVIDPTRRRLGMIDPTAETDAARGTKWTTRVRSAVRPMARYVMPTSDKEVGSMQQRFVRAGWTSADAMPVFYALKIALAAVFFLAYTAAAYWLPSMGTTRNMFFAAGAAFLGLMLPNFFLNRKVERRQRKLRNAFPDALDLLVVCVESGLGLAAALQRVALELKISAPDLAAELERVNAEMQAGMDRELALKSLATRTGLSDIRALVGLLVQTLRFGTSVADTLRMYAEEFRDKRLQAAEERAATLGTKMIFPMVVCFFPSFFLVAIGPGIIRVLRVFGGHG